MKARYAIAAGALLLLLWVNRGAARTYPIAGYPGGKPPGRCDAYRNEDGIIVIPICGSAYQ